MPREAGGVFLRVEQVMSKGLTTPPDIGAACSLSVEKSAAGTPPTAAAADEKVEVAWKHAGEAVAATAVLT